MRYDFAVYHDRCSAKEGPNVLVGYSTAIGNVRLRQTQYSDNYTRELPNREANGVRTVNGGISP